MSILCRLNSRQETCARMACSVRQKIPAYGVLLAGLLACPVQASSHLEEMGLDQLMQINVTGASKYEQKQSEVAAAVSILTQADIKTYGWRNTE